jgi:hypothetical protein
MTHPLEEVPDQPISTDVAPGPPSRLASGNLEQSAEGRRINVLLLASGLGIGGAETVMRDLARTLERRRFNVSVCCLKERGLIGEDLVREGIDLVTLSNARAPKVD